MSSSRTSLILFTAMSVASAQAVFAGSDDSKSVSGADYLAPVTPYVIDTDLRDLPKAAAWQPGDAIKEIPKRRKPPQQTFDSSPRTHGQDPLLEQQRNVVPSRDDRAFNVPTINMDGQGFSGVNPPDTMGDVGQNYYIQMINGSGGTQVTVYNKSDGSAAAPAFLLDTLAPVGTPCATGLGDPVVLYDELAGRWMLSEFSSSGNQLCVYVSQTADPITGGWFNYAFTAPSFPDYPKYSVWPDAYHVTSNESTPAIYALDRINMLAGNPATMQRKTATSLSGFGFQALTPADHDGALPPPAGAPGLFMRHRDTEVHGAGACTNAATADCLEVFEFHVDWNTPANSSFTMTQTIEVAEFDSDLCGLLSFNCFPQPGSGTTLDPLREVVMWRLQYRNFGSHEALIGNFVTDVNGNDLGGVRWFEARRSGAVPWTLQQEGTYSPDAVNRWMGAISMDGSGNIAVGYNVSDATSTFPGLRYAGRLSSDAAGTLPQGEHGLVAGSAANASNRYGDYSAMSVDPVDGCTFWFTGEYNATSSWSTRIGAFKFDTCTGGITADFTLSSPSDLNPAVCAGAPVPDITVDVGSVGGFTDDVALSHAGLAAGFVDNGFTVNPVSPPGSSVASVTVGGSVASGAYPYEILGSAGGSSKLLDVTVDVFNGLPGATSLHFPLDAEVDVSVTPTYSWSSSNAASYLIEVATDAGFSNIVDSATVTANSYTAATPLAPNTQHYWRVTAMNSCGSGAVSTAISFTTVDLSIVTFCRTPALPIPTPPDTAGTVADTLTIPDSGNIVDVDVELLGTHSWIGDLEFTVTSPAATDVFLFGDLCGSADNFDITLDDESANGPAGTVCPLTDGLAYTPSTPLSAFDGESLTGDWTLTVVDDVGGDSGQLDEWCLTVTYGALPPPINCDGASATLIGAAIPPGETVTCNVGDILVQDLLLGGTLIINKYGEAQFQTPVQAQDGSHLEVNEVPAP